MLRRPSGSRPSLRLVVALAALPVGLPRPAHPTSPASARAAATSVSLAGSIDAESTSKRRVSSSGTRVDAAPAARRRGLERRDYILPSARKATGRQVFRSPGGPCFECGRRQVVYTDFEGEDHDLTQHSGRHVALLLPRKWPGDNGFDDEEIRLLLDRADLVYEHAAEVVGREPAGRGLLPIAFVPEACGWGCGHIGGKGVEILDADWSVDGLRRALDAGLLHPVVVHELMHNFDVFWTHLYYLPDHAHAWTDFMEFFVTYYSRMGVPAKSAESSYRDWIRDTWEPYRDDPSATWQECVRDGGCEARGIRANGTWAGVSHSVARLHGAEAIKEAMAFLGEMVDGHPAAEGAVAREDLRIEALAAGATRDLSCNMNEWRWQASSSLRRSMRQLYGGSNPTCKDLDGDGFSVSMGDCDDSDRLVNPGRTERSNSVDDDCDGRIDELEITEPAGSDFSDSLSRPFEVGGFGEISGRVSAVGDADFFSITVDRAQAVVFEICGAPDFEGWLFAYEQDGTWLDLVSTPPGRSCDAFAAVLDRAGAWRFGIDEVNVSSPGRYTIRVSPVEPREPWGRIEAPIPRADGYLLRATSAGTLPSGSPAPTHVRFWVSGFGFVGTVPYTDTARLRWSPEDLPAGTYSLRAQLLSDETPVSDVTPARVVFLGGACDAGEHSLCLNQGRFLVEVDWENPSGEGGAARAETLTDDTGYFWFFGRDNVEVVVKVLDACGFADGFWVFGGGLTNVKARLRVTDTFTGDVRTYTNPQGSAFQPIQDTSAFATCSAGSSAGSSTTASRKTAEGGPLLSRSSPSGAFSSRRPLLEERAIEPKQGGTSLLLDDGRFRVTVDWRTPQGDGGLGQAEALTADTGYFWFFSRENVEIIVKVLDACGFSNRFWVFAAGLTSVEAKITVEDTRTGAVRRYTNPQSTPFQPVQDSQAFATCP